MCTLAHAEQRDVQRCKDVGRKRERPQLKIIGHFINIGGELVEIDPRKVGNPDRCKQVIAEVFTGNKYRIVDKNGNEDDGTSDRS